MQLLMHQQNLSVMQFNQNSKGEFRLI